MLFQAHRLPRITRNHIQCHFITYSVKYRTTYGLMPYDMLVALCRVSLALLYIYINQ